MNANQTVAPTPRTDGGSIADLWAVADALSRRLDRKTEDRPDSEDSDDFDRVFALEDLVLFGQMHTRADAMAKLKAVAVWIARGERADDDLGLAQAAAIAWLEAN